MPTKQVKLQQPLLRRTNSSDTESMTDSSQSDLDQLHLEEGGRRPLLSSPSASSSPSSTASSYSTDGQHVNGGENVICENLRQASTRAQALKLCFGASGIYACYLVYGHIQEDVFRYRAEDGTPFTQVWFLQVLECACNVAVGMVGRRVFGGRRPVSYAPFFQSGASQVFSKVLTSLSLAAGLSFPVCTLAKSAKMVPVMIGQLVLGGSKYTWKDYAFAGAVVVGTSMLSMGKSSASAPQFSTPIGLAFIILSLVMDGITGGLQKRLKKETEGQPPTTYDFLFFTNLSMGAVALTIALAIGDLTSGLLFMAQNPVLQRMIVLECVLSAVGQSFIFYVVANFDPMVCATITTTRKILSVLWSIAVKGHSVSNGGYAGLTLAIGGILFGLHEKLSKKRRDRRDKRRSRQKHEQEELLHDPLLKRDALLSC